MDDDSDLLKGLDDIFATPVESTTEKPQKKGRPPKKRAPARANRQARAPVHLVFPEQIIGIVQEEQEIIEIPRPEKSPEPEPEPVPIDNFPKLNPPKEDFSVVRIESRISDYLNRRLRQLTQDFLEDLRALLDKMQLDDSFIEPYIESLISEIRDKISFETDRPHHTIPVPEIAINLPELPVYSPEKIAQMASDFEMLHKTLNSSFYSGEQGLKAAITEKNKIFKTEYLKSKKIHTQRKKLIKEDAAIKKKMISLDVISNLQKEALDSLSKKREYVDATHSRNIELGDAYSELSDFCELLRSTENDARTRTVAMKLQDIMSVQQEMNKTRCDISQQISQLIDGFISAQIEKAMAGGNIPGNVPKLYGNSAADMQSAYLL